MMQTFAQNWWALVLRGIFAVIFGLLAFFWPGITLLSLVLLFGAYALVDGVFALASAISGRAPRDRLWEVVLQGVAGIALAVLTVIWPGITALTLVYLIAAWALITGALEIAAAIRLRREIENEWLLAAAGVLSVLFGLYAAFVPAGGALAIVWTIGSYALIAGALLIGLGLRLRSLSRRQDVSVRVPTSHAQAQRVR